MATFRVDIEVPDGSAVMMAVRLSEEDLRVQLAYIVSVQIMCSPDDVKVRQVYDPTEDPRSGL